MFNATSSPLNTRPSRQPVKSVPVKPVQAAQNNEESKNSVSESVSNSTVQVKGKRGRKLTEEEKYKNDSLDKIAKLQNELKKKNLSVAAR